MKDAYLGIEDRNWLKTYSERYAKGNAQYDKEKAETYAKVFAYQKDRSAKLSPEHFVGTYRDAWFGDVVISKEKKTFRVICKSSERLKGEVLPYSKDTFLSNGMIEVMTQMHSSRLLLMKTEKQFLPK